MEYKELKSGIKDHLNSAAEDFFMVGYFLRQISDKALFLEDGYKSIWEFAKGEYNLSTSSASRFMAINARFSIDGGEHMAEKYIGMGVSRLQEMLGLPDEELEKEPEIIDADFREVENEPEPETQEDAEDGTQEDEAEEASEPDPEYYDARDVKEILRKHEADLKAYREVDGLPVPMMRRQRILVDALTLFLHEIEQREIEAEGGGEDD